MTIATNRSLAELYAQAKRHEYSLSRAVNTAHPVEREVFGELHQEARARVRNLEKALEQRNMTPEEIGYRQSTGTITPHKLIAERESISKFLGQTLSEYTTKSSVRRILEREHRRLSGDGQAKLEILTAALVSDQ